MPSEWAPQTAVGCAGLRPAAVSVRLRGGAVALPCLLVLTLASQLTPDPSGYGTHRQLGLTQCTFLARTGLPCPSCGLTTSVAASVRGRFALAVRAQPFGILLTAGAVVFAVAGLLEAATGRPHVHRLRPGLWMVWGGMAGLLLGWGTALWVGLRSGALPIH
jgi:hypothetical protein